MNTRHRVIEVQIIIQTDTMENEASGFSLMANDIGAPMTHRINTLYTDIPMYLQNKTEFISRKNPAVITLQNPITRQVFFRKVYSKTGENILLASIFSFELFCDDNMLERFACVIVPVLLRSARVLYSTQ